MDGDGDVTNLCFEHTYLPSRTSATGMYTTSTGQCRLLQARPVRAATVVRDFLDKSGEEPTEEDRTRILRTILGGTQIGTSHVLKLFRGMDSEASETYLARFGSRCHELSGSMPLLSTPDRTKQTLPLMPGDLTLQRSGPGGVGAMLWHRNGMTSIPARLDLALSGVPEDAAPEALQKCIWLQPNGRRAVGVASPLRNPADVEALTTSGQVSSLNSKVSSASAVVPREHKSSFSSTTSPLVAVSFAALSGAAGNVRSDSMPQQYSDAVDAAARALTSMEPENEQWQGPVMAIKAAATVRFPKPSKSIKAPAAYIHAGEQRYPHAADAVFHLGPHHVCSSIKPIAGWPDDSIPVEFAVSPGVWVRVGVQPGAADSRKFQF